MTRARPGRGHVLLALPVLLLVPAVLAAPVVGELGAVPQLVGSATLAASAGVFWARARRRARRRQPDLRTARAALETSSDAVAVVDTAGRIEWANAAFLALTGEPADAVPGQILPPWRTPGPDVGAFPALAEVLAAPEGWRGRVPATRADGAACTLAVTITPVRDDLGVVSRLVVVQRDVSSEIVVETERHRQEARFRALVEHAPDCISIIDGDGRVVYESPAVERVLGFALEDRRGIDGFALVHPDDVPAVRAALEQCRAAPGAQVRSRFRHRHRDGTWRVLEATATNLLDEPAIAGIVVNSTDVTTRLHLEESLQRAEAFLAAVFEFAPDPFCLLDVDGRFVTLNRALEELLDRDRRDLTGRHILESGLVAASDQPRIAVLLDRNRMGQPAGPLTIGFLERGGLARPVEIRSFPVDVGVRRLLLCIGRDVGEQRAAAELLDLQRDLALRLSAARDLDEAVELVLGVARRIPPFDCGMVFLRSPEGAGYDCIAARGLRRPVVGSGRQLPSGSPLGQLIGAGQPVYGPATDVLDELGAGPAGDEGLLAATVVPFAHDGRVAGALCLGSHRHDEIPAATRTAVEAIAAQIGAALSRLRHQRTLAENEERLRLALEATGAAVWDWQIATGIMRYGGHGVQLFGTTASPIDSTLAAWRAAICPEDLAAVGAALADHLAGRTPEFSVAYRVRSRSGTWRRVRLRGRVVERDADGTPLRVAGMYEKADARTGPAAADTAQAGAAATAARRARGGLVARVTTELRAPLDGILGLARLLLDGPLAPQQRADLEAVRAAAADALALVDDLRTLARLDAGLVTLRPEPLLLRPLLDEILRPFEAAAAARGVALAWSVAEDVPEGVCTDAAALRAVLRAVVGNAVRFTKRGRIEVRVARAAPAPPSAGTAAIPVEFAVHDTGVGIPPDRQRELAAALAATARRSRARAAGTGLGLTLVARLQRLLGARTTIESQPGCGTVVRFVVPLRPEHPVARAAGDDTAPDAAAGEPRLRPLRVLVIEDDEVGQRWATRLLERHGHTVTVAGDGRAAVEAYRRTQFDLILMDLAMPNVDGFQATATIRRLEQTLRECGAEAPRVPIVAISAQGLPAQATRCLAAGMDAYVAKPADPAALFRTIARVVPDALRAPVAAAATPVPVRLPNHAGRRS